MQDGNEEAPNRRQTAKYVKRQSDVIQEGVSAGQNKLSTGQQKMRKGGWTAAEHSQFLQAILECGISKWKVISTKISSRSAAQCQIHYFKLKQRLRINDDDFISYCEEQLSQEQQNHLESDSNECSMENCSIIFDEDPDWYNFDHWDPQSLFIE